MPTILVVDDMPIFREPIAATLRQEGFKTACAANGQEALDAVAAAPPDLILLDLGMPVMDGLTFLKALRQNPATRGLRVIILTALSERSRVEDAARLGVQGYLLKSRFSTDELVARIRKSLAAQTVDEPPPSSSDAESARPATRGASTDNRSDDSGTSSLQAVASRLLTREDALARLDEYLQVKTLAGNVAEVLKIAGSPRADAHELAAALKHDPVIAARVLQLANSAAYQTGKAHVSTIDEAVRVIGFNTIRTLASSIGIFETFPAESADGFSVIRCWQHSFAVASIMNRIVPPSDSVTPGLAHLVGLCHELAEIIVRQLFAAEHDAAISRARATGDAVHQVELEILGLPRYELVGQVMNKLHLPPDVADPIRETGMRAFDHTLRLGGMARALRLANDYAHGCLLAPAADAGVGPATRLECQDAVGDGNPKPIDPIELRDEVYTLTNMLIGTSSAAHAAASQPLFPFKPVRVWYARHTAFSQFDPLGVALQLLSDVERFDRLPQNTAELSGFDGMVVVVPSAENPRMTQEDVRRIAAGGFGRPLPTLLLLPREASPLPVGIDPLTIGAFPQSLADLAGFVRTLPVRQPAAAGA